MYFFRGIIVNVCLWPDVSVPLHSSAAGKVSKEEGKPDIGVVLDDGFPENLRVPPTALELPSNAQSSR